MLKRSKSLYNNMSMGSDNMTKFQIIKRCLQWWVWIFIQNIPQPWPYCIDAHMGYEILLKRRFQKSLSSQRSQNEQFNCMSNKTIQITPKSRLMYCKFIINLVVKSIWSELTYYSFQNRAKGPKPRFAGLRPAPFSYYEFSNIWRWIICFSRW